jgi:hypothetical protein
MDHRSMLTACCLLLLTACQTRSLSQPYADAWSNRTYRGELNDWDVVGTDLPQADPGLGVKLRKGQRVLLLQSGAMHPDPGMLAAVAQHFQVAGATGLPSDTARSEHGLRGAAARGGYDLVIAFWGAIEVQREATLGSAVAWVPIVNFWVDTSEQNARLRLRMIVLDARTGNWRIVEAAPQSSVTASSLVNYREQDSKQMEELKAAAYAAAGAELGRLLER